MLERTLQRKRKGVRTGTKLELGLGKPERERRFITQRADPPTGQERKRLRSMDASVSPWSGADSSPSVITLTVTPLLQGQEGREMGKSLDQGPAGSLLWCNRCSQRIHAARSEATRFHPRRSLDLGEQPASRGWGQGQSEGKEAPRSRTGYGKGPP